MKRILFGLSIPFFCFLLIFSVVCGYISPKLRLQEMRRNRIVKNRNTVNKNHDRIRGGWFRLSMTSSPSPSSPSSLTNELLPEDFLIQDPSNGTKVEKKSTKSVMSENFEILMTKLGKCSKKTLRDIISRYNVALLPEQSKDLESHITIALEALWSAYNGKWDKLLETVSMELDDKVKDADKYLIQAVQLGENMSETKIKELIRKHSESNNIPKFDKRKYVGKLLKGDYYAELIDILREEYDGDYFQVVQYLKTIGSKKRGFG